MLSFRDTIDLFFLNKTSEQKDILANKLENEAVEYYADTWKSVTQSEMTLEKVQLNLLRTLYQLQFSYYAGIGNDILFSLEDWSEDTAGFLNLKEEDQIFYERFYTYFAFQTFDHLMLSRKVFLLGSRFVWYGFIWEIPVYESVQKNFVTTCDLETLRSEGALLVGALQGNGTKITEEGPTFTIGEWIKKFQDFLPKIAEKKIEEFINGPQTETLFEEDRKILLGILDLFSALQSENIWKNIENFFCIHEKNKKEKATNVYDRYLHLLKQTNSIDIWLKDASNAAEWFISAPVDIIKNLITILKEKVDLSNFEQVEPLSEFFHILEVQGKVPIDVLIFDESDGEFHWNENVFKS